MKQKLFLLGILINFNLLARPIWEIERHKKASCRGAVPLINQSRIPIVKTSNLDVLYQRLPVLIVGDWNVITQEFLEEQYKLITQQKLDTCLLDSNYWQNSINFLIKEQV